MVNNCFFELLTKINRDQQLSVSGTDGGKLEVYLLAEARSLASLTAHQDAVTALRYKDLVLGLK